MNSVPARLRLRRNQAVQVITPLGQPSTKASLLSSRSVRTRRYVLSMGLRAGCFVAAIFSHGWWQATLLVAAVIVPYFAVLLANSDTRTHEVTSLPRR